MSNDDAPDRPAHLPPRTNDDKPPSAGGPWTKLHAGINKTLKAKIAKLERDATPPIHGPGSEAEPVRGTPPEFTDPEPQELPETPPADPVARYPGEPGSLAERQRRIWAEHDALEARTKASVF